MTVHRYGTETVHLRGYPELAEARHWAAEISDAVDVVARAVVAEGILRSEEPCSAVAIAEYGITVDHEYWGGAYAQQHTVVATPLEGDEPRARVRLLVRSKNPAVDGDVLNTGSNPECHAYLSRPPYMSGFGVLLPLVQVMPSGSCPSWAVDKGRLISRTDHEQLEVLADIGRCFLSDAEITDEAE